MVTATARPPRSGTAPQRRARPGPAGPAQRVWLSHAPAKPFPSGGFERGAPDPASADLIRLHRHSLFHLLLVGGTAEERARLAFAFHRGSPLKRGPFVRLDGGRDEERLRRGLQSALCGVVCERPDNPLRASEGGTLFLDGVSRLSPATQKILLRLLASLPAAPGAPRPCFGRLAVGAPEALEVAAATGRFQPALLDMLDKIRVELRPCARGGTR